ncbi:Hypothetical Protein FCC1311_088512 [Hondaea fermentalgiana]|uniref:Apple domain-containing protein n=2 Tax=Hondaea fermentalgiana TaxID=2315210 RepID=A0A2R5GP21_9STRA|nr:Hypothetical Protein FCC1311_088512 [Hondaea fermentalgiana]|eukprot:GBG32626.1 Hypothetical Protein FCC1311_088512 [Hondaea fermentalgiana]
MDMNMRASILLVLVMAVLATMGEAASLRSKAQTTLQDSRKLTSHPHKPICLAFKKLGDGFCREKVDHYGNPVGTGTFNLYKHIESKSECAMLCYEDEDCTGWEYDSRSHRKTCEVHRGEVGAYKAKHGVECYEAYKTADKSECFTPPRPEPEPTCEYKLVGNGYCREAYDHDGTPYGLGDYKTYCNKDKPCVEDKCREACTGYEWCKYYEFKPINPDNLPWGTHIEEGAGRCELYRGYIGAYKPSSKAKCYAKNC